MSAVPASPAKKAPAKKKAPKKPAEHPKYIDMVVAAIVALKDRKGSSRQAIVKFVAANNKVGDNANKFVNQALKKGVAGKKLKFAAVAGRKGAGSFKVDVVVKPAKKKKAPKKKAPKKKKKAPKKKVKKVAKKPAAKKAKKPAAKKAAAKKPAAKKPAAKKPAAKKAVKKPAAKKAAKKPAAKKAAKK